MIQITKRSSDFYGDGPALVTPTKKKRALCGIWGNGTEDRACRAGIESRDVENGVAGMAGGGEGGMG